MIYFIQAEDSSSIKIGYTKNLKTLAIRIKTIQTYSPMKLKVIEYIQGEIKDEREIHGWFDDLRLWGEWFMPELKLLYFIDGLNPLFFQLLDDQHK